MFVHCLLNLFLVCVYTYVWIEIERRETQVLTIEDDKQLNSFIDYILN